MKKKWVNIGLLVLFFALEFVAVSQLAMLSIERSDRLFVQSYIWLSMLVVWWFSRKIMFEFPRAYFLGSMGLVWFLWMTIQTGELFIGFAYLSWGCLIGWQLKERLTCRDFLVGILGSQIILVSFYLVEPFAWWRWLVLLFVSPLLVLNLELRFWKTPYVASVLFLSLVTWDVFKYAEKAKTPYAGGNAMPSKWQYQSEWQPYQQSARRMFSPALEMEKIDPEEARNASYLPLASRQPYLMSFGLPFIQLSDYAEFIRAEISDEDRKEIYRVGKEPLYFVSSKTGTELPLPIKFEKWTPNEIRFDIEAPHAGEIIFAQTYAPDWKAMIDGKDQPIVKAKGTVMSVGVPGGNHRIRLVYSPRLFVWSLWIYYSIGFGAFLFVGVSWLLEKKEFFLKGEVVAQPG